MATTEITGKMSELTVEEFFPELQPDVVKLLDSLPLNEDSNNLHQKSIAHNYTNATFFNNKRLSDLKLKVVGTDTVYDVHKFVLASICGYFEVLFENEILTNSSTKFPITLLMRVPAQLTAMFEKTLKFLYDGKLTLDKNSVLRYYHLADILSCETLRKECIQYICDSLKVTLQNTLRSLSCLCNICQADHQHKPVHSCPENITNVYSAIEVSEIWINIHDKDVKQAATQWFASKLKDAKQPYWSLGDFNLTHLQFDQVCAILDCNIFSVYEYKLFEFATDWLKANPSANPETVLFKIRHTFMHNQYRAQVMKSEYIRNNHSLMQAVINGAFYKHVLLHLGLENKPEFAEFDKPVYKPRKMEDK